MWYGYVHTRLRPEQIGLSHSCPHVEHGVLPPTRRRDRRVGLDWLQNRKPITNRAGSGPRAGKDTACPAWRLGLEEEAETDGVVEDEEEAETRLKASAFLDALSQPRGNPAKLVAKVKNHALSIRVLLVDHEVRPTQNLPNHFCPLTILTLLALCNTP